MRKTYLDVDTSGEILSVVSTTDPQLIVQSGYFDITDNKDKDKIIKEQRKYKVKNGKVAKKKKKLTLARK